MVEARPDDYNLHELFYRKETMTRLADFLWKEDNVPGADKLRTEYMKKITKAMEDEEDPDFQLVSNMIFKLNGSSKLTLKYTYCPHTASSTEICACPLDEENILHQ
jgi:hypothetical protein